MFFFFIVGMFSRYIVDIFYVYFQRSATQRRKYLIALFVSFAVLVSVLGLSLFFILPLSFDAYLLWLSPFIYPILILYAPLNNDNPLVVGYYRIMLFENRISVFLPKKPSGIIHEVPEIISVTLFFWLSVALILGWIVSVILNWIIHKKPDYQTISKTINNKVN